MSITGKRGQTVMELYGMDSEGRLFLYVDYREERSHCYGEGSEGRLFLYVD